MGGGSRDKALQGSALRPTDPSRAKQKQLLLIVPAGKEGAGFCQSDPSKKIKLDLSDSLGATGSGGLFL